MGVTGCVADQGTPLVRDSGSLSPLVAERGFFTSPQPIVLPIISSLCCAYEILARRARGETWTCSRCGPAFVYFLQCWHWRCICTCSTELWGDEWSPCNAHEIAESQLELLTYTLRGSRAVSASFERSSTESRTDYCAVLHTNLLVT
jgi:hypothetical protein